MKLSKKLAKAGIINSPGYNPKKDKHLKKYYSNVKRNNRIIKYTISGIVSSIILVSIFILFSMLMDYIASVF